MTDAIRTPASPTSAYRADMRGREHAFGPHDDRWLAAATSLRAAVTAAASHRQEHLYDAIGAAIDVLGDERIDEFVQREWLGDHSYIEALAVLTYDMHEAGALRLSAVMLDDLLRAAPDLSVVHRGRILAMRARLDWKLGAVDEAAERYAFVGSLADETDNAELRARVEIGRAVIAQLRGNIPDVRDHCRRAADIAEARGMRHLAGMAYQGLMMAESRLGNVDGAMAAAWQAFTLGRGNSEAEATALQQLGQLLLEHGLYALARAAFAAVMAMEVPARFLLAALGGLALASARSGREATVEWAVRETWRAQRLHVAQYELAQALVESAEALALLSRDDDARRYAEASHALATLRGFHELVFRAEAARNGQVRAQPARTATAAPVFAPHVAKLEPERLPERLRFEAAPA
jgi:hypothetical protein